MSAPGRDIPEEVGNYRVISSLGSGGMGAAYLVENKLSGRRSVMKVSSPDLDERGRERFFTELNALRRLEHPNILALQDFGELDRRPFLVTEWVEGSDLRELLESQPQVPLQDVLLLLRAVANALGCAHGRGILHLDVKPENILVPNSRGRYRFEEAKLLDFGVLGKLQPDTHTTLSGSLIGTPYYMSPEQVRAEALTPAADIFSLGVVAYKMLSGRRPFEAKSVQGMFYALLSEEPEPLGPPTPPEVADLVRRCLEKDPHKRPSSGSEVAVLIGALADRPAGEYTRLSSPTQAPMSAPAVYSPMIESPVAAAAPKSRSIISTVAIVLAGFFGVVGVVLVVVMVFVRSVARKGTSYPPPPVSPGTDEPWLILAGALLIAGGVVMGIAMRRYLAHKREQITGDISKLLAGGRTRKALSMTLAIQVDEVIAKCRLMDEKFLGLTMAVMVKEYNSARKFDDRQKALMNAIAILDKLGPKLSPWYVRHEKMVATGVSMVGIISGLATAATSVAKLVRGTP
jgi:tRNA A-37 threonylcarbamoyl transferase component Bud32